LKMLKRDVVKMKDELCYMEEDIQLLADAFDTLFTDLISEIKEKIDYPTEEI
jgi:hypothetical protein